MKSSLQESLVEFHRGWNLPVSTPATPSLPRKQAVLQTPLHTDLPTYIHATYLQPLW